jgi:hypothetical protein
MKSDVKKIRVVRSGEPNFDRACEEAYNRAVSAFEIDEFGHSADERFPRSSTALMVRFTQYVQTGSMGGQELVYEFDAWMETD